jgi:hypothetical protein
MIDDSIACRSQHAMMAATDAGADPAQCQLAGPVSNGGCANPCAAYCDLEMAACPGAFPDVASCQSDCSRYAVSDYSITATTGDSFACRMYWLTQAASDPSLCPDTTFASSKCRVDATGVCDTCTGEAATTLTGKCSAMFKNCISDPNSMCAQCYNCAKTCGADQTCFTQMCEGPNPTGCSQYAALLNCIFCDQCPMICASLQMQDNWVCK